MIPKILSSNFKDNIKSIVKSIFKNLNVENLQRIQSHTITVLTVMAFKYGFTEDTIEQFTVLMTQNNNQHIKSIIKLLLPYIDDINDFQLFESIEKFEDITIKKKPDSSLQKNPDKNPYLISTYQYSRYQDSEDAKEYEYNDSDFLSNFRLLLDTIEYTRTKLCVNWLDILPITKQDYKESRLYKNSFQYDGQKIMHNGEKLRQWSGNVEDPMITYSGISVHDMFNGIHVFLFNEIFNSGVKWLMYEKQINVNEKPVTYIEILNEIINIKHLSSSFTTLSNSLQNDTDNNWKNMKNKNNEIYKDFIKCVIFKFDLNYCTPEISKEYNYDEKTFYEKYKEHRGTLNDEDKFLDLNLIKIDDEDYLAKVDDFFNKIPFTALHDFFDEQIIKFKRTWYGQNMLREVNGQMIITSVIDINEKLNVNYKGNTNTFYLTYKNIYNYAKYISLETNDKKSVISDSRSLTDEGWTRFFNILNGEHGGKAFNINKVITKTYINANGSDINNFQKFIEKNFKITLRDNIFLIFIGTGLLTEIIPTPSLTDKNLLGADDAGRTKTLIERVKDKYIKNSDNNKKYLDTEYYLTRDKYSNLELYKGRNGIQDDQRINWFEHMTMGEPWYNYFALSLVSQVNFYHHFLNNRVMMVTGSTGQGKSVLVPILFYYATVALTLNSKAKILSTQALVAATTGNSNFMALNLGVPIEINGHETPNPYIQYSTQKDKHDVRGAETYIKEVTDRTLLEELQTNPLLKKPIKNKHGIITDYRDENLYDVIIIDEAHMHNVSMDLILTIVRNTIMINNQIRLVITSATMDADEFIYRRFYKHVNDNYMFPMFSKSMLINGTVDKITIDRSCVDRRFHISPPGETSRFTVTDIYLPDDSATYEEAEEKGIETMRRIINSTDGDIIFFTTTTVTVKKLVRLFNSFTESHIIALPLYSKMREIEKDIKWFDMIKGIDKTLPNMPYGKDDIMDVIESGTSGFTKVRKGTYTRAIIVATPVVEASVTIGSAKIVVDTGYANNINFDVNQNKDIRSVDKISDASRLQRRGRIGRKSSGTCYYMYKEGSRAHIKSSYELVTKDITFDLFKILSSESTEKFVDFDQHPQNYDFKNGYKGYNDFKASNSFIKDIYEKQYRYEFTDTTLKHPFIDVNISSLSTNLSSVLPILYVDGYGITDLIDVNGTFYIIHPGETYIKRDVITGKIIENNKKYPLKYIISHYKKILFSLQKMQFMKYIFYDKHFDVTNSGTYENDQYVHKHKYITVINNIIRDEVENLGEIANNYPEDEMIKIIKTIFTANKFNCLDRVIRILALMYSIGSYKTFIRKQDANPKYVKLDEFKAMWTDNVSELFAYEKIINKFIETVSSEKINIIKNVDNTVTNDRYALYEKTLKDKGMALMANDNNIDNSNLSRHEMKVFTQSKNGRFNESKRNEKYVTLIKNVVNESANVETFSKVFHVNPDSMHKAIRLYNKFSKMIEKDKVNEAMIQFKDIYTIYQGDDNVLLSFMDNYGSNLIKYDNNIFSYILNHNIISGPKISLLHYFKSYYFYTILSADDELLGLTVTNVKTIQSVFHMASYQNINKETDKIRRSDAMTNVTSKTNIVNPNNKQLDMNNILKADLNFK